MNSKITNKNIMNVLKINTKYQYFEKTKKPVLGDYNNSEEFETACILYKCEKGFGGFIDINSFSKRIKLKKTKVRRKRLEINIGSTVFIDRWDGNGICDKVKVISIKAGISRVIVKTNKGVFVFSKWNSLKDNIDFKWTCKGKKWEKKNMRWINGNNYYLNMSW